MKNSEMMETSPITKGDQLTDLVMSEDGHVTLHLHQSVHSQTWMESEPSMVKTEMMETLLILEMDVRMMELLKKTGDEMMICLVKVSEVHCEVMG